MSFKIILAVICWLLSLADAGISIVVTFLLIINSR
jgi:hypothetical protein